MEEVMAHLRHTMCPNDVPGGLVLAMAAGDGNALSFIIKDDAGIVTVEHAAIFIVVHKSNDLHSENVRRFIVRDQPSLDAVRSVCALFVSEIAQRLHARVVKCITPAPASAELQQSA
jgi:hypothetical protein